MKGPLYPALAALLNPFVFENLYLMRVGGINRSVIGEKQGQAVYPAKIYFVHNTELLGSQTNFMMEYMTRKSVEVLINKTMSL